MGEALMRAVVGRTSSVDDSMFRAGGRVRSPSGILHDDQGLRFALLREGVEQAYRQVDAVVKISTEPCSFSTTTSSRSIDGCVQPVMEAVETTTFPLDLAKCGAALWQAARRALWSDYAHVEIYGDDPEWRMGRVTWSRNAATIQSSVVIRRIEERDRELIVWRAVTTLGACQIQYVEETGYAVLQRVRDASGGDFVAKTNFMEWVPRSQSEISRPVADLASLVVAVTHEDTAGVDEMMENLLIEECLGVDL